MQNIGKFYAGSIKSLTDAETLDLNLCWFCDQPTAEQATAAEIHVSKELNMQIGLTGTKHTYQILDFKIPCCRICSRTHRKARIWSRTLMWLGGIGGFLTGLILPVYIALKLQAAGDGSLGVGVILSIIGGTVLGIILGYLSGNKIGFAASPETKPLAYSKQHPQVAPLLRDGWFYGKPL